MVVSHLLCGTILQVESCCRFSLEIAEMTGSSVHPAQQWENERAHLDGNPNLFWMLQLVLLIVRPLFKFKQKIYTTLSGRRAGPSPQNKRDRSPWEMAHQQWVDATSGVGFGVGWGCYRSLNLHTCVLFCSGP